MTVLSRQPFGVTRAGEPAERITLDNGILSRSVLTYGAILQSLLVTHRNGCPVDVVLGLDTLDDYLNDEEYLGAVVGLFAGRIAAGRFTLDGREYTLAANNGPIICTAAKSAIRPPSRRAGLLSRYRHHHGHGDHPARHPVLRFPVCQGKGRCGIR